MGWAAVAAGAAAAAGWFCSPVGRVPPRPRRPTGPAGRRRRIGPTAAGLLTAVAGLALLGWPWGVPAGMLAVLGVPRLLRLLETSSERTARLRLQADLPLAADLLAGAVSAGCPTGAALEAVAAALDGVLAAVLARAAAELSLGADSQGAWNAALAGAPTGAAGVADLAEVLTAADSSGLAPVAALHGIAARARAATAAAAAEHAQRAGVRSAGPLGLCFLPAFVVVGIVPALAAAARALLR